MIPPMASVTTPIRAATKTLSPLSSAINVPLALKAPGPNASGHLTVLAVSSTRLYLRINGARIAMPIRHHSQNSFSTQKNGLRSKSRSLTVPAPKAVTKARKPIPKRSAPFRTPSTRPVRENASTPMASRISNTLSAIGVRPSIYD